MRTIKAALTKLKNQIEDQLDLTEEFLPGLPYSIIIKEINLLQPLIEQIEKIDNPLETIYLKRYCQKCISILQNSYKIKERSERDNLLLASALIKLRRYIKETYLIEVKRELRSEIQLQGIEKEIDFMQGNLQRYIDLDEKLTQFEQLKGSLEEHLSSYKEQASNAQDIAKWHKSSQSSKDKINQYVDLASRNSAQISSLAATARQDEPVLQEYKKEINMLTEQFRIQKNEIQTIIEDANRASMAGAFKNQADDINKKMKWADGILITSLVISSLISLWGFSTSYNKDNFDWVQFISKISITIPFILIAGIKAREREYLFRIREDYAYKYSSAMAFEGYKKQIQEQDPELQQQLLQIALNNLGEKPTRVFEKEISATPAENLIDIIGKRLDNSMNNKSKEIPNKNKELIDD